MRWIRLVIPLALAVSIPHTVFGQGSTVITGHVRAESGNPIVGAAVRIEGLAIGTITNSSGNYTLTIPAARVTGQVVNLSAKTIGYSQRTVRITLAPGNITQDFTLSVNAFNLDEVVVTGAGTTTSVEKLGNVRNTVDSSLLRRSNETNIVNALAGKAPNVEVSSQSGEAGASSYIRIRGARTIGGTGQPLFVVDGQPIDNTTVSTGGNTESTVSSNRASDINPNDIESVEILKGAAAAAIYGARAGQGVILITTKSGRPGPTR